MNGEGLIVGKLMGARVIYINGNVGERGGAIENEKVGIGIVIELIGSNCVILVIQVKVQGLREIDKPLMIGGVVIVEIHIPAFTD